MLPKLEDIEKFKTASNKMQANIKKVGTDKFGSAAMDSTRERFRRLCEEVGELGNTLGIEEDQARKDISYGYSRPLGKCSQEIGGVGFCVFALAESVETNFGGAVATEIERLISKDKKEIQIKHNKKVAEGHSDHLI